MSGELERVAELVRREIGIALAPSQMPGLEAAIGRVRPGIDAAGLLAAIGDGSESRTLLSRLVDEVTVKETYFFREPRELGALDWERLHAAAWQRGEPEVKVWVAACASGEEAYTVAMLAAEAFRPRAAPVSILGTDVSEQAILAAKQGRYRPRSVRYVPSGCAGRYLERDGSTSVVTDPIRRLVEFRTHNLAGGEFPPLGTGPFDLVTCRNVLIYFDPDVVQRVIAGLDAALAPGGRLILGAADRLSDTTGRLTLDAAAGSLDEGWVGGRRPASARHPRSAGSTGGPRSRGDRPGRRPTTRPTLDEAVAATDADDLAAALQSAERALDADPLDAEASFVRGFVQLGGGDAPAAVASFRRALYIDPSFALAAFHLGRAHELCGQPGAAARAYRHALRINEPGDPRQQAIVERSGIGDLAAACRARLRAAQGA